MRNILTGNTEETDNLKPLFFIRSKNKVAVYDGNYKTDTAVIEAAQSCAKLFSLPVEIKTGNPVFEFPEYKDEEIAPNCLTDSGAPASGLFEQQLLPLFWFPNRQAATGG